MHFEYMELEAPGADLIGGRKISSLLTEKGYKSLYAECAELVTRYVLGLNGSTDPPGSASDTRTVDVLIPPTDPSARIVIGERPAPGTGGVVVAVIAVGRSQEDAHRSRIAVKMVLDRTAVGGEETFATYIVNDNGRASERRFRQEWVRAFGLVRDEGWGPDSSPSLRQATTVQVLLALQETPPVLGRPGLMRSRVEKEEKSRIPDPAILDGLVAERLVEKAYILVCRQTGQVVGVGKDVSEVRAAMRLSLRCPHCQSPLGEEIQDVLYSLTEQGDEFLRSTSLILGALDAALRKNGCDEVVLGDGLPEQLVDAAACYQDAVLLFRVSEAPPRRADLQALQRTMKEFMATESEVTVLGAYVAAGSDPEAAAAANDPHAPCMVLEISDLETGVDRLLEDIRRANFARLTGSTVAFPRPDLARLLSPDSPAGDR